MKKNLLILVLCSIHLNLFSKINLSKYVDTVKSNINYVEEKRKELRDQIAAFQDSVKKTTDAIQEIEEVVWDNGIPIIPDNERVMDLIYRLNTESLTDGSKLSKDELKICRELGLQFYQRGLFQEADFYFSKIKDYTTSKHVEIKDAFDDEDISVIKKKIRKELIEELAKEETKEELPKINSEISQKELDDLKKETEFLKSLPSQVDKISKQDLAKLSEDIENQIQKLIRERDLLIKNNGSQQLIDSKNGSITTLKKEKQVIDLSIDKEQLKEEKTIIQRWLWGTILTIAVLVLSILAILQRKTIKIQDAEIAKQLEDINKKNTYLEHAARIIRHDMHSGINTYIPRGISSLEKRISPEQLIDLRIDGSVKMIREGLNHTQKVYKSVYEFTNLVKQHVVLDKKDVNLKELFDRSILTTSYSQQVEVAELPSAKVNETLFWNAIDNLIKNGLKYNKSEEKKVKIYNEGEYLIIEDNGLGLTQNKFNKILSSYSVEEGKESGLGLNICVAILKEHGFELSCEKVDTGTKMKIKL